MTALGGGSNAQQATAAGSLQLPTSQVGGVIPLVYGTTRVATNLLDYPGFHGDPGRHQGPQERRQGLGRRQGRGAIHL